MRPRAQDKNALGVITGKIGKSVTVGAGVRDRLSVKSILTKDGSPHAIAGRHVAQRKSVGSDLGKRIFPGDLKRSRNSPDSTIADRASNGIWVEMLPHKKHPISGDSITKKIRPGYCTEADLFAFC